MNNINKEIDSPLIPTMAIIVYQTRDSRFYLERKNIKKDGTMGVGVPLTEKCLTNLITTFSDSDKSIVYGTLPQNFLYADSHVGREKYVWYRKEEKRMLLFDSQLKIPNGEMYVPALIYKVENNTLSVYAYKGKLSGGTPLYRAPFYNVSSANVCLGNAKLALPLERTYTNIMEYWETMFWKSEFVSERGGNPVAGDLRQITKDCITKGLKFPSDQLIPIPNKKLKDLLK